MALHPNELRLYQVWDCSAEVMAPGPRFRSPGDALAFVNEQTAVFAIQRPDGSWLKPPPARPPEPTEPERRRSRRVPVSIPGRLELTPGRFNAAARQQLPLMIVDAAAAGLRLRLNGAPKSLRRHELVRVMINSASAVVQLPAQIVWVDGTKLGVHFKLVDRQLRAQYQAWLGRFDDA